MITAHTHSGGSVYEYEHAHAFGDVRHDHFLRQVCGRAECAGSEPHNIHPSGGDAGTTEATALFAICPVPGCANPVADPRDPCLECREAFGGVLQVSDTPQIAVEEFTARAAEAEARVSVVLAERKASEEAAWKRNQICWCCEERRTCRVELVGLEERWVCRECAGIR